MATKRCENGHIYDEKKYSRCPHCGIPGLDLEQSLPKRKQRDWQVPKEKRVPKTEVKAPPARPREDAETIGLAQKKLGFEPIVGWLVCTEGAERGRDYRVRAQRNFVGRSKNMDICIGGDATIAREKHATITFDPRTSQFHLLPGESRSLVYLNTSAIHAPTELSAFDVVELGETKLVFVPLCGDRFQWNQDE